MTTLRIALKTSELEPKNEKGREITAGEVSLSPEITYHSDRYPNGRSDMKSCPAKMFVSTRRTF